MRSFVLFVLGLLMASCEISSVALAEPEDLLLAEIYVELPQTGPGRAVALLHRTLGTATSGPVSGARVTLTSSGQDIALIEAPTLEPCLHTSALARVTGTCFEVEALPEGFVTPGGVMTASIDAGALGTLTGTTTVPGEFALVVPGPDTEACLVDTSGLLDLQWTSSAGAWAYVGETLISGIPSVLEARGIEGQLDEDPLYLLGLSISAADTTMTFPSEFGVFDRFDLDQDVALLLQEGLPQGTWAQVTIAGVDRNYVNWVRGGSFNPSGTVRIPSLRGDGGSGVFASYLTRTFTASTLASPDLGPC